MIPRGWFASLVLLPTIIDGPGLYRTRGGETVRIIESSTRHAFACNGHYVCDGVYDKWHKSGRLYFEILSDNDIVQKLA